MQVHLIVGLSMCLAAAPAHLRAEELSALARTIRSVAAEGRGNPEAASAWNELADQKAEALPEILAGMDGCGPLAVNWMRAAAEVVAQRSRERGEKFPTEAIKAFLADRRHDPRSRRLAFELLQADNPQAAELLIPSFADDPSTELRREAVTRLLSAATESEAKKDPSAPERYRSALSAARDPDQIKTAHEALKKLGQTVDLARHFGFICNWKLVGPFDNSAKKGFAVAYPPETQIKLDGSYDGKQGAVKWIDHVTTDENGRVDVNKAVGKHMGAVVYAVHFFESDRPQPVDVRLGSSNATKVWLNGKLIHSADIYHANVSIDQYTGRGQLEAGRNVILVKVCQNEQTEEWAQEWRFQLRVCDSTGTAVLSKDRPAAAAVPPTNLDLAGSKP